MPVLFLTILAFMLVVGFSLALLHLGRNSLRRQPEKLLHLIRQARSGQLQEMAWTYGLSQPYFHAPEVDEIREELLELEEKYWAGKRRADRHKQDFLLNEEGLKELERLELRLERILEKPTGDQDKNDP